ncbi:Asp23/Gls24 family envelope stress response protein, partial [Listeria monocytogenes]|nr:Asp23/Gls24 family envelope stress response protein [Listeria monocytogenes]
MAIEIDTKLGKIDITSDVIATIAGGAAEENFGIV